jgi:Tol biopolymer transport system component
MTAVTRVGVALLALGLLAGCDRSEERRQSTHVGRSVTAPPQETARVLAVRLRPESSKPTFALVTLSDAGSDLRVLARAPAGVIERLDVPAWSPDARRVYFVGTLGDRQGNGFTYYESDVFVIDAEGGAARRVTTSRDVLAVSPSPDGRTLLVARDEDPGVRPLTFGLWLLDVDGGHVRRLLEPADGRLDLGGSWSPDGRTIAFTRCTYSPPDLHGFIENTCAVFTVARDGSTLRRLAGRSSQPTFSPDGRLIAFVSDRDENGQLARGEDEVAFANDLYVMDADGRRQRRLAASERLDEGAPSWSPDGSRIAYAREGPARFVKQLMVVAGDGSCPTRLIGDAAADGIRVPWFYAPAWRPGRITGRLASLACNG